MIDLEPGSSANELGGENVAHDLDGHPRGTLVIIILFGLLFALGWLWVYLFLFLERGAPHS
jgi:hypothetical protein